MVRTVPETWYQGLCDIIALTDRNGDMAVNFPKTRTVGPNTPVCRLVSRTACSLVG
jgi:hypothetical protein